MDLKHVLELLYSARNRFETIQMEWVYAYDKNVLNEMFNHQSDASWVLLTEVNAGRVAVSENSSKTGTLHQKIMLQKEHLLRFERKLDGNERRVWVINGDKEWHFTYPNKRKRRTKCTNREAPVQLIDDEVIPHTQAGELLDPSFLLAGHNISLLSEESFLNREVVRFQVSARKHREYTRETFFWNSTNENELLIDKKRGTLLHYAMKVNGYTFAYSTVSKIVYDEDIPKSDFLAGILTSSSRTG